MIQAKNQIEGQLVNLEFEKEKLQQKLSELVGKSEVKPATFQLKNVTSTIVEPNLATDITNMVKGRWAVKG